MNPSLEAWPPLARVRSPARTSRPGLGVLPNPPEACLGPMRLTPLHSLPTLPSTDSGGRPPRMKERRAKRVARFACSEPSMARLYRKHCRIKQKGRGEGRVLFVFLQFVSNPCSCPPSPGNCRRRDGYRWRDRPRHGCRGRAPMDGFTACPAICTRPAKLTTTQSRFGFGSCFQLLPAAGGPPRVSAAPPHPTRSGSSHRCRRCRSSRSGSSPGTAGDSPRRSSTPAPGTRSRW